MQCRGSSYLFTPYWTGGRNVTNTLAHTAPAATAAAHTVDKILFPDKQSRLCLAIHCLAGEAMDQVQQYVKADCVDLENMEALIDILEEAFGNPNCVAEAEAKLCSL